MIRIGGPRLLGTLAVVVLISGVLWYGPVTGGPPLPSIDEQCERADVTPVDRDDATLVPLVQTYDGDGDVEKTRMVSERRWQRLRQIGAAEFDFERYPFVNRVTTADCYSGENVSGIVAVAHTSTRDRDRLAELPDEYGGVPLLVTYEGDRDGVPLGVAAPRQV